MNELHSTLQTPTPHAHTHLHLNTYTTHTKERSAATKGIGMENWKLNYKMLLFIY